MKEYLRLFHREVVDTIVGTVLWKHPDNMIKKVVKTRWGDAIFRTKSSRPTVSKLKKKTWDEFSRYIRLRDCLLTTGKPTEGRCYTCNKIYPFKSLQAGHFIPGRHPSILFDDRGVHAQCYHCNVGLKGNWPEYYKAMVTDYGKETTEAFIQKKHEIKQFKVYELEEIRETIKNLTDNLNVQHLDL